MTNALLGYGAKIKMGDGASPENFALIGEIGDFDDADSIDLVEVTNHQSPGKRKEYISGLIDGDEISFPVNYNPTDATHDRTTGIQSKLGDTVNFRFEEPGNTQGMEVGCVVIGVSKSYPVADKMQMTVRLKKSGAPSFYTIA